MKSGGEIIDLTGSCPLRVRFQVSLRHTLFAWPTPSLRDAPSRELRRVRSVFERTDNIAERSIVVRSTEDHTLVSLRGFQLRYT